MEPPVHIGLVARRDQNAPNGVRFARTYEIYSEAPAPKETLQYKNGTLEAALLWGTSVKQLRSFAIYLFGRGDLQVAEKPLRHDPTLLLFSSPR